MTVVEGTAAAAAMFVTCHIVYIQLGNQGMFEGCPGTTTVSDTSIKSVLYGVASFLTASSGRVRCSIPYLDFRHFVANMAQAICMLTLSGGP